jgi:ribose transport system ATP-binding protein
MIDHVSFRLHYGEVVGIAGLMGAGRTETTRAIFGADPLESGAVFLDGKQLSIRSPLDAIRSGIVLIPEDRKKDGLCVNLSVEDNLALTNMDQLCTRAGVLSEKKKKNLVDAAIQNLKVKLAGSGVDAGTLSGGNQQKIVIGKWLARASRVIIFDEPTRGIDVAAKVEIYNLINQLKQQGIGIICVSSELPEIMGISDRIIVMCNGRITGEVQAEETTQQEIMTYATEFEEKDQKNGGKK